MLSIDPSLLAGTVDTYTINTFKAYASGATVKWNEAELALYLLFIYGEVCKSMILPTYSQ